MLPHGALHVDSHLKYLQAESSRPPAHPLQCSVDPSQSQWGQDAMGQKSPSAPAAAAWKENPQRKTPHKLLTSFSCVVPSSGTQQFLKNGGE